MRPPHRLLRPGPLPLLPHLVILVWGAQWSDARAARYHKGLSLCVLQPSRPGADLTLYNPRSSLERLMQLRWLILASRRAGIRCALWGGYRHLALTRALLWGQGVAAPSLFIWAGGRPPRRLPQWRRGSMWLTTTPTLEGAPYSGLTAHAALWALWEALVASARAGMGEILMALNGILVLIALSFGIRAWALTSILVLLELGWVVLAAYISLWSYCGEDVSLLFVGISLIFVSTIELALGVAIFVVLASEQGRVYLTP